MPWWCCVFLKALVACQCTIANRPGTRVALIILHSLISLHGTPASDGPQSPGCCDIGVVLPGKQRETMNNELSYTRVIAATVAVLLIVYFSFQNIAVSEAPLKHRLAHSGGSPASHASADQPALEDQQPLEKVGPSGRLPAPPSGSPEAATPAAAPATPDNTPRPSKAAATRAAEGTAKAAKAAKAAAPAPAADGDSPSDGPKKMLRILAIGDSLTAGFTNGGRASHPYTAKLQAELRTKLPSHKARPSAGPRPGAAASAWLVPGQAQRQQ
jgi:hypothetical protein